MSFPLFHDEKEKLVDLNFDVPDAPQGSLHPLTSTSADRYDTKHIVEHATIPISPAQFLYSREPEPEYLPPLWTTHTDPEGQVYFYKTSPLRVVTNACIYRVDVLSKVERWTKHIESLLVAQQIAATDTIELFVQIEDDNDCGYYLVDYASRTQFWLEPLTSDDLDLPYLVSHSHLKLALEGLFWTHVEHFPMHFGGLLVRDVDDLICIFSHALADQMTSTVSTYYYNKESCAKFLKLLRTAREHISDGHQTCLVARLWSLMIDNRVTNHYGEEQARLSRDQAIIHEPSNQGWAGKMASALSFKASEHYLQQLDGLFVDHVVYVNVWRPFMSDCLNDWRRTSGMALGMLLLQVCSLYLQPSPILATASFALTSASLVTSVLLGHRYKSMDGASAGEAHSHLTAIRSEKHSFEFVAFVFSLPIAFLFWGLGTLFANAILLLALHYGLTITSGVLATIAVCFLLFQRATSESCFSLGPISTAMRRLQRRDTCETSAV